MSNDINGKKCACCGAYLFPEDDVVFCPVCGAPHHRDCYNLKGQCAYESLHGTDRQYDKVKEEASKEKEEKTQSSEQNSNTGPMPFPQFDMLSGIPADFDLGDGVTAAEASQFVFSNSHRYVPKFAAAKYGKRLRLIGLLSCFRPLGFYQERCIN